MNSLDAGSCFGQNHRWKRRIYSEGRMEPSSPITTGQNGQKASTNDSRIGHCCFVKVENCKLLCCVPVLFALKGERRR